MRKWVIFVLAALVAALFALPAAAQERPTVAEILAADADGRFTTLLAAVEAAGLTDALSGEGTFTVLAPTNAAFEAAFAATGIEPAALLADTETLTAILTYHVLPVRTRTALLFVGAELTTLNGESVRFSESARGQLVINDGAAQVLDANLVGSNGVVHAINAVLLPSPVAEAIAANRGQIRVAHFSPDAGPVDIYINGELSALQGVTFGAVSDWIEVPARAYNIAIAPAGGEPGEAVVATVEAGSWTTIAAIGVSALDSLQIRFLAEDFSPIPDGTARISVFHAIQGAPIIDVRVNGSLTVSTLGYPGTIGDNDGFDTRLINAGSTNIQVVPNGATSPAILEVTGFPINAGTNYLIAAVGIPGNPQLVVKATVQ